MNSKNLQGKSFVGVDISKTSLDVYFPDNKIAPNLLARLSSCVANFSPRPQLAKAIMKHSVSLFTAQRLAPLLPFKDIQGRCE